MGRNGSPRLPSFCLNRVVTRVRVRSPITESKPESPREGKSEEKKFDSVEESSRKMEDVKKGVEVGRRIMIVVESSPEAKTALLWALSHTVQSNDVVVLIDVVKPSACKHDRVEQSQRAKDPKFSTLLQSMRSICQSKKPEVQVELVLVEGKDRGPTIVDEARNQCVSLLVMGQKKRSMTWRLMMMWAGNRIGGNIVDYCIQNASCMTLAVRKKSRKGSGYLITTKKHKDFWLLA